MSDDEVQEYGAGASKTYPEQSSKLRKNGHVMIKGKPCKVIEMSTSKTGKHGHAKVHYVGLDIFTGKKYEDICPSTHSVDVPHVNRVEYQILEVEDGFVTCLDAKSEEVIYKIPDDKTTEEVNKMLEAANDKDDEAVFAHITCALGEEVCLDIKPGKQKP